MFRNIFIVTVVSLLLAVLIVSCSDDPVEPDPVTSPYKGLTQPDDVLFNLELSVGELDYDEYKRFIDPEFVFVFSESDQQGLTPENWNRASEMTAMNNMLDPNYTGDHPVSSIEFSLQTADDDWIEITPPDTLLYPGESWYKKAVTYSFELVSTSGWTFMGMDLPADIFIRQEDGVWRMVEWRDDTTGRAGTTSRTAAKGTVAETTWGAAKFLYKEDPGYQDLTARDDVLINLELAYDDRDISRFEPLIADDFMFVFSDNDYGNGITPVTWDGQTEVGATQNLFDPSYENNPATGVVLQLDNSPGGWTPLIVISIHDPAGELWYLKTVKYSLTVKTADVWYESRNFQTEFAVRRSKLGVKQVWQIVAWQDDVTPTERLSMGDAAVEDITWGKIKTLFSEEYSYRDLSIKDDVFHNLELLYPARDVAEYERLLDHDMIFFFSDADIANGIPFTEWYREDEIRVLTNMGDKSRPDRILSINLDLAYSLGPWTAIVPENPKYAGEIWYQKTVVYNFTVQAEPDMTYIGTDIKAQFTIRESEGEGGAKRWRIVRWRDDITGGFFQAGLTRSARVQDTTWGGVKALYE